MADEIIKIQNLKKYFHTKRGIVKAADGVSFTVSRTETLGLVGESGSGKSTVAYTVMGIYAPTEGSILFKGEDISRPSQRRPKGSAPAERALRSRGRHARRGAATRRPHRQADQLAQFPEDVYSSAGSSPWGASASSGAGPPSGSSGVGSSSGPVSASRSSSSPGSHMIL